MGDGRYYTLFQFCIIFFLTIFLISICISGVLCFYQEFRQKKRQITAVHFFLGAGAALRFSETVFVSQETAHIAKCGEVFCMVLSLWAMAGLIDRMSRLNSGIYRGVCLFSGWVLVLSLFHREWLIQTYTFSTVRFGAGYLWMAGGWFLYSVTAVLFSKRRIESFFLFILPLGGHLAGLFISGAYGDMGLLFLYPACLAGVNILSADLKAYRIGGQVFSNINNLITDAVLICDPQDNIIYRNRHALGADFFKPGIESLTDGNPETLFNENMARHYKYNIHTFASTNRDRYMDCRTENIWQGRKRAGRSLILSDITDHIRMLDLQAEQKARLEKINQKLHHYSNIVFDLEKEKEISSLLDGITRTQEQFMEQFKEKIKDLSRCNDQDRFNSRVDILIGDAKENLSGIRQTVTRYRRFYGTGN